MTSKIKIPDIIIFVPGILGSVLQYDGQDLFALSCEAAKNFVVSSVRGEPLQKLMLEDDDYTIDLEDGITATNLIKVPRVVSGLAKIDGYTDIAKRIEKAFDTNYFEFPYDWRRDNRASACKLEKFIEEHLNKWRETSGAKNAKVILIAHSMGGLVSRYYLEVLGGWQNCKALITLGTPYRGSVKALNYIANGCRNKWVDLSNVMRSFTSVYQLLPIYEMLKVGDNYQRVTETDNIPNLNIKKAQKALKFHREIEDAQKENKAKYENYKTCFIIPCVGKEQKTFQSAQLLDRTLKPLWEVPPAVGQPGGMYDGGDGTVPYISATPLEFDIEENSDLRLRTKYVAETHSWLQNNYSLLNNLIDTIQELYKSRAQPVRGDLSTTAIGIEIEDLYTVDEQVEIKAQVKGNLSLGIKDKLVLEANIELVDNNSEIRTEKFQRVGDEWSLIIDKLEPGLYRLKVETFQQGGSYPAPVHDLFEVVL